MARHSILQTFYASKVWRDFRMTLIVERGLRCEHCLQLVLQSRELTAHHEIELTPDNVHDATIALNPKLVKLVHHRCHNEIHKRFGGNRMKQVFLIYGAPLAGKKTFVSEQMMRGDLVVDMDLLFEAISFQSAFDKPDNLLSNVMGVQNLLLDNIKTRLGRWGTAWVIGGYAERFKRERTADMLGAELVFIDTNRDECLRRLGADSKRSNVKVEWQGYIDKWFDKFQA